MSQDTENPAKPSPPKRWPIIAVLVSLAVVVGFLRYIGVLGGNVHTVVPGVAYRCAQLTGANLDSVIERDHVRTVINLRGGSEDKSWYRSEISSCRALGANHIDVSVNGTKLPSPAQMTRLLAAFDTATYPVLFHCQAGSDRTGLAGTLYLNVFQHVPLDQAESRQLTWHYGHFSFGNTHAMDDFYTLYRKTHGNLTLRQWIVEKYPAVYAATPLSWRSSTSEMHEYIGQS